LESKIYKSNKNYFVKITGSSRTAQWQNHASFTKKTFASQKKFHGKIRCTKLNKNKHLWENGIISLKASQTGM